MHIRLIFRYLSSALLLSAPLVAGYAAGVRPVKESGPAVYHDPELGEAPTRSQVPLEPDSGNKSPLERYFTMIDLVDALEIMQTGFFEVWVGTWPEAIDWTAAVLGTQVSASLRSMTKSEFFQSCPSPSSGLDENVLNAYFSQISTFYFGENAIGLRSQAYDDMLWVVLGWLEATQLINDHSDMHYVGQAGSSTQWYARQHIPAFAHRARIFWDLASHGWDTTLCGGGMVWSPYVTPYKNAITNELWIAASISMYLYFPGDDNASPLSVANASSTKAPGVEHDPKFLDAAIAGYRWLNDSNMITDQGLYADGFHVSGWRGDGEPGSGQCDELNADVYTYNQGVILTGMRGLALATGDISYLSDGHDLIRNVITATGWSLSTGNADRTGHWKGLGRDGVLEENCDVNGDCSQNGQTFKGIFFHHFTVFCGGLPVVGQDQSLGDVIHLFTPELAALHRQSCIEYAPWVEHNAKAALGTRDDQGKFGMWWTVGLRGDEAAAVAMSETMSGNATGPDYRNRGIPDDAVWRRAPGTNETGAILPGVGARDKRRERLESDLITDSEEALSGSSGDPNARGRGRTVETQSGGVAVLRARQFFETLGQES